MKLLFWVTCFLPMFTFAAETVKRMPSNVELGKRFLVQCPTDVPGSFAIQQPVEES